MKQYKVNRFWVEKFTGEVYIEDQFALDSNLTSIPRVFSNELIAESYILRTKKDWLTGAVLKWLKHKEEINRAYPNTEKQKSIDFCRDAINKLYDKDVFTIARQILKGKDFFTSCLPSASNNSYQSSLDNLQEIFSFCEKNKGK